MPKLHWECEECGKTQAGTLRPPKGWCELSFWNEKTQRFHRFSFCSYSCASAWAGKRYDEPVEAHSG